MEVTYKKNKLQKVFEDDRALQRAYGLPHGPIIKRRLQEIKSAECLADMPDYTDTHPLIGKRLGQYGVTTQEPYRIVMIPTGTYDKNDISTIKSIEIVDSVINYHDK